MTVTVNGTAVAIGAPFGPTGSWDTWSTLTVTGKLNAGTHQIRKAVHREDEVEASITERS